jgi:putative aldouronate transport system permease protein
MMQPKTKIRDGRTDFMINLVIYLILSVVILISLLPLIYILSNSISDPRMVITGQVYLVPKDLSFMAYQKVFEDSEILIGYRNTIFYTIFGTGINIVLTTLAAYVLSRKRLKGKGFFTMFIVFTMFFQGGMIPNYLLLLKLHMTDTIWALLLPRAISVFNFIIMRTFFEINIPDELYEAAKIDGCSNTGILLKIVLPLSRTILAVMVLYYGVYNWNSYFDALLYLQDKQLQPLQLVLRKILLQNSIDGVASEAPTEMEMIGESIKYAAIVVASLPILCLYPFLQKYFTKGVMIGAVKG